MLTQDGRRCHGAAGGSERPRRLGRDAVGGAAGDAVGGAAGGTVGGAAGGWRLAQRPLTPASYHPDAKMTRKLP
ncbi:MAG: hypothetical protein R3E87_10230 [Burkholderiaceae bacterium]